MNFDPTLPLEHACTIPNSWYFHTDNFTKERKHIFASTWQFVGRMEQLKQVGDFITTTIAGEPILVVRGEDRQLRAFFNVCRHRAAPILNDPCGHATKLRCRYHGWTYDLSGQLRGTPEFEGVCDFRKEDNGLVPIAVDTCGPFVFVHLGKPRESLEQFLSPFPAWANARNCFANLTWHSRKTYDLACNWKVYVDNYLDGGYHVNTVHPNLAGVLDYSGYTTTTHGNTSLQSSPMKPAEGEAGRTRTGDRAAYWWVYPNFMVNLYSGIMDTNLVLPIDETHCRVIFDFYFSGQDDAFQNESIVVAEQVQVEDIEICEEVQRGLMSSAFVSGRFSVKRENAAYHFHQLLANAIPAGIRT